MVFIYMVPYSSALVLCSIVAKHWFKLLHNFFNVILLELALSSKEANKDEQW
jgi:hypothetical protein